MTQSQAKMLWKLGELCGKNELNIEQIREMGEFYEKRIAKILQLAKTWSRQPERPKQNRGRQKRKTDAIEQNQPTITKYMIGIRNHK